MITDPSFATLPSWATVTQAAAALAAGRMVIVVDDVDRENEGDLVVAASCITEQQMAFMVRYTTGIICVPMAPAWIEGLRLPQMVVNNSDSHQTAFTVSVDHASCGTGVSAVDRTRTVHALANRTTRAESLRRPGHVFPLRARTGGVLVRAGHTEAAVDLMGLAGHEPVAAISELVAADGSMLHGRQLREFAVENSLLVLAIADLVRYHREVEPRGQSHKGELKSSSIRMDMRAAG